MGLLMLIRQTVSRLKALAYTVRFEWSASNDIWRGLSRELKEWAYHMTERLFLYQDP